ncbi:MAG: 3-isopropylmalate dehydratase large subunit [Pseudomonadota bacterium]
MAQSAPGQGARPARGRTLFDKIWDQHQIADLGEGYALLHVDRNLLHDLSGVNALDALEERNLAVLTPELHLAVPDHAISSLPGRTADTIARSRERVPRLKACATWHGIRYIDINDREQGIVHIIGPELGLTLPGTLITCGDSHTSTHGALGALAFGIGSTEIVHVLATQTLVQQRPKPMRVTFDGALPAGVTPKDMILHLIGVVGAGGGNGCAVEYAGSAIRALDIEGRLTICNMSIEFGAKVGMIAPDDVALAYLQGRPYAPAGDQWDLAVAHWRMLGTDDNATFTSEATIDVSDIAPQITWGTSPENTIPVTARVPEPSSAVSAEQRDAWRSALDYMALEPGAPIAGTPVDHVFIGSCTNGRLSDLEAAARIVKGRRVAEAVEAWVVPGSQAVKREAEALGLDKVFTEAGFQWREPGCSMCVAVNGDVVPPGKRAVSTSNRNFVGRQGPRARTHLASPAMAAAAAVAGHIVDVRRFDAGGDA